MRCFEEAVETIIGQPVPNFEGENWAGNLNEFLSPLGYRAKFIPLDTKAIVSRRLPNGKVHAEIMYPTLITILEKI